MDISDHKGGTILALGFVLLVAIASRVVWFGDPFAGSDEQLYSFIGWRLAEGELPYVYWWDRKPFGLFAIFAVAHAIGGGSALAYQMLALAFAFAGGLLVYALARKLVDRFTAACATARRNSGLMCPPCVTPARRGCPTHP